MQPLPALVADLEYGDHLRHVQTITEAALSKAGLDALVIDAVLPHPHFLDDQCAPLRYNPHFVYWTALPAAPGSAVLFRPGETPRLIWVREEDYWHMPPEPPPEDWLEPFAVTIVESADAAQDEIRRWLGNGNNGWVGESPERVSELGCTPNPEALLHYLHFHRVSKTQWELEALRGASQTGVLGHRAAEAAWRSGASAFEIHLAYLQATGHTDEELPYPSIVATGRHAAVLHYQHRDRQRTEPGSFLIDAGAQCLGYMSDITRTYSHDPGGAFAELIAHMEALQHHMTGLIRPGISYPSLHQTAHEQLARVLRASGIASGSDEALVATGVTRAFLPHGLGHMLGIQTHDVGGLIGNAEGDAAPPATLDPALRNTRMVEAGQVFTVEPGLYFIDQLLQELRASKARDSVNWPQVDALYPMGGIRIEDNVAVTATGCENLTRNAFAAPASKPAPASGTNQQGLPGESGE